jgi:hypothetical protein
MIDGTKYNPEKLFMYIVNDFHLGEIAKHYSVEMAITVDGAKLDENVQHIPIGFKICNLRACDTGSGKLIFGQSCEEGNLKLAEWYFPIMVIIAKLHTKISSARISGYLSRPRTLVFTSSPTK